MVDEVTYTRTVFSSFADNVIVVRMEADKPKALNFDLSYNSPLKHVVMAKGNELVVKCEGVEQEGIPAALNAECRILVRHNGKSGKSNKSVVVDQATVATLYISAATNFVNYHDVGGNASKLASSILKRAVKVPYEQALANHIAAYKEQFDRVTFSIPFTETSTLETDKRVVAFGEGKDLNLIALMFQYGRYLLISSSQPGGQPANLQGLWCTYMLLGIVNIRLILIRK